MMNMIDDICENNVYLFLLVSIKWHWQWDDALVTWWKTKAKKKKKQKKNKKKNPELSTTCRLLLELWGILAWEKVGILIPNPIPERYTQNLMKQKRGSGLSLGILVSEAEHSVFLHSVSKLRAFTLRAAEMGQGFTRPADRHWPWHFRWRQTS